MFGPVVLLCRNQEVKTSTELKCTHCTVYLYMDINEYMLSTVCYTDNITKNAVSLLTPHKHFSRSSSAEGQGFMAHTPPRGLQPDLGVKVMESKTAVSEDRGLNYLPGKTQPEGLQQTRIEQTIYTHTSLKKLPIALTTLAWTITMHQHVITNTDG